MPFRSPALAGKVTALCPDSRIPVDFRETTVTHHSQTGVKRELAFVENVEQTRAIQQESGCPK